VNTIYRVAALCFGGLALFLFASLMTLRFGNMDVNEFRFMSNHWLEYMAMVLLAILAAVLWLRADYGGEA
jgi:hypothetical protein